MKRLKNGGITRRRVSKFCQDGRIDGAKLMGKVWFVSGDAEKPEDPRKAKREQA